MKFYAFGCQAVSINYYLSINLCRFKLFINSFKDCQKVFVFKLSQMWLFFHIAYIACATDDIITESSELHLFSSIIITGVLQYQSLKFFGILSLDLKSLKSTGF